jgi:hypothetical protein
LKIKIKNGAARARQQATEPDPKLQRRPDLKRQLKQNFAVNYLTVLMIVLTKLQMYSFLKG